MAAGGFNGTPRPSHPALAAIVRFHGAFGRAPEASGPMSTAVCLSGMFSFRRSRRFYKTDGAAPPHLAVAAETDRGRCCPPPLLRLEHNRKPISIANSNAIIGLSPYVFKCFSRSNYKIFPHLIYSATKEQLRLNFLSFLVSSKNKKTKQPKTEFATYFRLCFILVGLKEKN